MLYSRLDISSERWWSAVRDDRSCHWKSRGQADLWNSPEQWTTIPPQCLTAQFRALCFRVLARQGAHRQFPFALFQPGDSGRSQQQGHHPERRKDTTTLAMQKQYPDLRGDDFLATITQHAHLQSTNISIIEAKHASVRRQLTARSVQTWALKMAKASAEWLCQHIRRGKLSKLSGPSACPLPLQLLHCQQLRAVRARRLPKRQGSLSWRVSTSTLASDIISLPW